MRLLWNYLEQHGRPVAFYTDKAAMFQSTPKIARDRKQLPREEREPLPPTQMGRALQELGIVWIAAHSPQAKGRVERSFGTAQDRLVKGLRIAGAKTLEQANRYLEGEFVPWWNQHLVVDPAHPTDAHRPLGTEHNLAAALSRVETRQVNSDYTVQLDGKRYGIVSATMPAGLRGAVVRLERRLNGSLAVRFRDRYLGLEECGAVRQPKPARAAGAEPTQRRSRQPHRPPKLRAPPKMPLWESPAYRCGKPPKSIARALPIPWTDRPKAKGAPRKNSPAVLRVLLSKASAPQKLHQRKYDYFLKTKTL